MNTTEIISTHQQLMDEAYERWQQHDARIREDYALVIKAAVDVLGEDHHDVYALRREVSQKLWSKETFWAQLDERESVAVLTANMNYQVENGGWLQWCDNGYVDCAAELETVLREKIGTETAVEAAGMVARVAGAWERFQSDKDETPGYLSCRCDDEDECDCEDENDIWQAAHDEFSEVAEPFDSRFYEINEQLMADIERFLNGEALEKYSAPVDDRGNLRAIGAEAEPIRCKLIGKDGNAFSVIGSVSEALRKGGRRDLIEPFRTEAMSGDYNGVLQAAMKYVEVV
jgi:hypothetical protein